jgi:hypothetical protein
MPHDVDDRELKPGDRVLVECVVESVQPSTEYCNVTLKTAIPMPPYTAPTTIVLNTKQVRLISGVSGVA